MARQLQPLGDNVVVKPVAPEEVSKGGIFLPDTAQERPREGKVIAVGPGRTADDGKNIPMELKVGDLVVYRNYAGTEFKEDEDELLVLRESDVLAKITS